MKKVYSILLCSGISFFVGCAISKEKPTTSISVLSNVDAGIITENSMLDSICIINTGSAHLLISKVQPGCACTVIQFDSTAIPPGDSSFIPYRIDFSDTGYFEKSIVIEANTDSIFHAVIIRGTYRPVKK
jgi:hypothetical protein